jgi:hypothetical protein
MIGARGFEPAAGIDPGFVTTKANERGVRNMNIKLWSAVLLVLVTLPFLAACQAPPMEQEAGIRNNPVNYTVDMAVADNAMVIALNTPDRSCTSDGVGKNGCVQFGKGTMGTIEFRLNNGQAGTTCQTDPAANWVITRVQLSSSGDSTTEKGTFGGKQPQWLVSAFPPINEKNGTLYDQPDISKATQSVTIINLNNHEGTVKTAYYEVTASSCADRSKAIQIDPVIRNKGK